MLDDEEDRMLLVLFAAQKYQIPDFAVIIGKQIMNTIDCESFFELVDIVQNFEIEELSHQLGQFITENTDKLIENDKFVALQRDSLALILKQSSLSISESELFDACMKWTRAECGRNAIELPTSKQLRQTLGDLLFLMRIQSFNSEDWVRLVSKHEQLFNSQEIVDVLFFRTSGQMRPDSFVSQFRSLEARSLWKQPNVAGQALAGQNLFMNEQNRPFVVYENIQQGIRLQYGQTPARPKCLQQLLNEFLQMSVLILIFAVLIVLTATFALLWRMSIAY